MNVLDFKAMERAMNILWELLRHAWAVLGEMAPWVLGGFAVAGVLSLWLNARAVREHFGGGRFGAILKAVALGVPLPVCSCGVIPLGASLRKHGAGKGPTAAFVMSTPQTGVDSIAVTFGMMGGLFAVFRPLAALVSGVACGLAVEALDGDGPSAANLKEPEIEAETRPWWARVFHNGFIVLPRSVGGALVLGALVSAAVMALVPENFVAERIANPLLQMVLTLAIGIPMYVCSTAAVPFALGLLAACAIGFGLLVQALVPPGWAPPGARLVDAHAHCATGLPWNVHLQAAALLAVLAWAKWGPRKSAHA